MGILVLFETNLPASNLWTALSVKFTLSYFSLSLSLNVLLTFLIVIRLLLHRQRTRKHLGAKHATHYTSIAAMLVESSALYSAFSLIFIVSYARNSPVQNLFLPVLAEVQVNIFSKCSEYD
jgi:succinate-acetate transporter protein